MQPVQTTWSVGHHSFGGSLPTKINQKLEEDKKVRLAIRLSYQGSGLPI